MLSCSVEDLISPQAMHGSFLKVQLMGKQSDVGGVFRGPRLYRVAFQF